MPIQFSCTNCNKQLKVGDESAGAKAKCPQCQTVVQVPSAAAASGLAGGAAPPPVAPPFGNIPGDAASNPYSAPPGGIPAAKKIAPSGQPTAVGPGEVIEYAWNVWKQNLGILVGITIAIFAINLAINIGFSIVQNLVTVALAQELGIQTAQLIGILIGFFGNFIQLFFAIGQTQIILKLLRGQHAEFGDLFGGGSLYLRTLGAVIVAGLAVLAGFLLLIIPGIILSLLFWTFYYFVVDNKAKAMESFSKAYEIGKLNVGTTFVLWLASMGVMMVGMLACGIGILLAAPLTSAMFGAAYLMMSGQIGVRPKY